MPPVQPYHYGSHYSNSGTVLHFLVRLPPFTKMFLAYQGRIAFNFYLGQNPDMKANNPGKVHVINSKYLSLVKIKSGVLTR